MPVAAPILGNIALNLAIGVGASLLAGLLKPPQQISTTPVTTSKGVSFDLTIGESVPLFTIFGRARTAGHLIFAQEYGTDNEYLKLVIVCGKGHYDALEEFIVDETVVTLSGSNSDTHGKTVDEFEVDGTPYMWIKTYDGAAGQTADAGLIAAANPSDRWTVNHTLTGTPYAIVTLRWNSDLYGGTLPTFGFVWRGLKLYDWREDSTVDGGSGSQRWADQSTWEWTENPAVIAYNWRRGYSINGVKVFGLGFPATANDLAYFTSCANVCDETVVYPETGASLARYAYGKQVTDADDRLDVLRELEASWCGASFSRGGAYAPVPAATQTAVMTLEDSQRLVGYPVRADKWGSVSAKKTAWHGDYVSQADGWQVTPYGTRFSTTLETLIGGRRSTQFNQPFEYKSERAQMRAEIALRRQSYPAMRTETFGPRALVLEPGDCITRSCDWGDVLMIVESVERLPHNLGVTLTMSEWNNAIVPASNESFVDLPPSAGTGPAAADRTLTIPSPFVVAAYGIQGEGMTLPGARATWPQITDPNVTDVLIRVWPTAGSEANDAIDVTASAKLQTAKIFGPLQDNTEFTYKGTVVRNDGRTTAFTSTGTFTTGEAAVPTVPADNSIELSMLVQELQNQHGLLVGSFPGSFPEHLAHLEQLIEQLAANVITGDETNKQRIQSLIARMGTTTAAVVRNEIAIAEANSALAQLDEEVIAVVNNNLGGGLFRIQGTADSGGASAEILMLVKAALGLDFTAEAAIRLKAIVDGVEGHISYVDIMADRLRFITTAGGVVSSPFQIEGGVVKLLATRATQITSLDGTSMVINWDDPEIYMEA